MAVIYPLRLNQLVTSTQGSAKQARKITSPGTCCCACKACNSPFYTKQQLPLRFGSVQTTKASKPKYTQFKRTHNN